MTRNSRGTLSVERKLRELICSLSGKQNTSMPVYYCHCPNEKQTFSSECPITASTFGNNLPAIAQGTRTIVGSRRLLFRTGKRGEGSLDDLSFGIGCGIVHGISRYRALRKPHHRTIQGFQAWMEGEPSRSHVSVPGNLNADRLRDAQDPAALHTPWEQDSLTKFLQRYVCVAFILSEILLRIQKEKVQGNLAHVSETRLGYAVATFSILLSAILLIGAVVNLYLVQSPLKRLGLVRVYTAAFSANVGI